MKAILAAATLGAATLVALSAQAKTITVAERGGFVCKSERDLDATLAGKFKARPGRLGPSCEALSAEATILDPRDLVALPNGSIRGRGDFRYKGTAFFVAFEDGFTRLAPIDVRNAPEKWRYRDIEFGDVSVYWVGDDDVRILTDTNLVIAAAFSEKDEAARYFAANCETMAAAISPRCSAMVRFVYVNDTTDKPDGYSIRHILIASEQPELIRKGSGR